MRARRWERISWGLARAAAAALLHWTFFITALLAESLSLFPWRGATQSFQGDFEVREGNRVELYFYSGLGVFVHFHEDGAGGSK